MPPWEFWPLAHLLMMMLDFSNITLMPNSLNFYLCTFTSSKGRKKCVRVLLLLLNFPFYTTIDLLYCIFMTKNTSQQIPKVLDCFAKMTFSICTHKKECWKNRQLSLGILMPMMTRLDLWNMSNTLNFPAETICQSFHEICNTSHHQHSFANIYFVKKVFQMFWKVQSNDFLLLRSFLGM